MTSKKQARRALVASFTSLLLCCAMLIGTTFAWFTDVAETGLNQIIAGNLDIELLDANGNNIEGSTELFVKPELWEPGAVAYAQMQVKNVGNLDLKYSVCVNYENVNYLNNHGLSEVLKYAVIDLAQVDMSGDDNADRAAVLAAAMAAKQQGNLYDYTYKSELKAGEAKALDTFVVFWAPNNDSVDNLYNVNNGQKTSDGKPLQINLGIKVVATQLNSEEDSFGPDYDLNAPQLIMVNGKYYEDLATAIADAKAGGYTLQLLGGAFDLTNVNGLSIEARDSVFTSKLGKGWNGSAVSFNCTNCVLLDGLHFDAPADDAVITFTDCYIDGKIQMGAAKSVTFTNCEFSEEGPGSVWTNRGLISYCPTTFIDCELNGRLIAVSPAGMDLTMENCTTKGELLYYAIDPAATSNTAAVTNFSAGGNIPNLTLIGGADAVVVSTSTQLKAALASGEDVVLTSDFTVAESDSGSNGYGATGITVGDGQTFDGNGHSFGADLGATWDSAISTTGGTIKNLTIDKGFRGVFIKKGTNRVQLENVVIDGTTYTISCDKASGQGLTAKNCTFNGWTSFAGTLGDAEFVNCSFGAGNGYNFSRPYAPTVYENCNFAAGHRIDPRANITLKNCTLDGVAVTDANLATLVTDTAKVTLG